MARILKEMIPETGASAGTLSAQERASLQEQLERTGQEFDRLVRAIPTEMWNAGTDADVPWSLAQLAEHVVVTESELTKLVREKLLTTPVASRTEEQNALDEQIPAKILDVTRRPQAPESVRPRGRWLDAASLLAAFHAARQETLNYIRDTEDPLRLHRIARPGLGNMDGYHWLLMMVTHTERHVRQMQERLAEQSPSYGTPREEMERKQ
jgi:hypothetical protein